MKTCLTIKRLVLLLSVMFIVATALVATVLPADAEDRLVEGAMILAPVEVSSRMGNMSEDTLEACLARISERITPEQRMLARQVCHEEEATRKLEPLRGNGD